MTSAGRDRWLAINFAATIFVSAFLLFQVQPLVSKYILPWFGGSPAVWTTCMLFFQSLLFLGYAYAHFSVSWLKPKAQAALHLVLIAGAIALIAGLGVVPGDDWKPTDSSNPIGKILTLLAATVGLPYFVLSSTGPLVQAWFAQSFPGRIPYRLYALSNVGSLLALISYPFLFERIYDAPQQAGFWSGGFVVYGILGGIAALSIWMLFRTNGVAIGSTKLQHEAAGEIKPKPPSGEAAGIEVDGGQASTISNPHWWHRVLWLALPAFASMTLLATTNHITTDVTPMPFLWVMPLSLYLITFIIAFDHPRWYQPVVFAVLTLLAVYLVAMLAKTGFDNDDIYSCGVPGSIIKYANQTYEHWQNIPKKDLSTSFPIMGYFAINFAAMFGICMLCHGELVRLRPNPKDLTAYYLMIAAGGAVGGLAVSILAPQIFVTYFEFKLVLFFGYLLAIGMIARGLVRTMTSRSWAAVLGAMLWVIPALALPTLLIAGYGIYDLVNYFDDTVKAHHRVRNFFGTLSVLEAEDTDDQGKVVSHYFLLKHGGITHGLQFTDEERRHLPTTYYSTESGLGLTIGHFRRSVDKIGGLRVGAVGLGTGTLAAYIDQGDYIRFYEINQAVIDIAESGKWFTYLKDCRGKHDVKLGDARLTLESETEPQRFNVLVLDAFSGDAIPMHLLSKEAFDVYEKHLSTPEAGGAHGAIAVHISNRYLNLEPVVRGLAEKFGFQQVEIENDDGENKVYDSNWIILTRNQQLVDDLKPYAVKPRGELPPSVLWTDKWSNLFDVMKWGKQGE